MPELKFRSRKILKPSLIWWLTRDKSRNIEITEKLEDGIIGYGQDSSVGTAIRYGLDGPGMEILAGTRFSASFRIGPGTHTASCTMGTESLFRGVKRAGRGGALTTYPQPAPSLTI